MPSEVYPGLGMKDCVRSNTVQILYEVPSTATAGPSVSGPCLRVQSQSKGVTRVEVEAEPNEPQR